MDKNFGLVLVFSAVTCLFVMFVSVEGGTTTTRTTVSFTPSSSVNNSFVEEALVNIGNNNRHVESTTTTATTTLLQEKNEPRDFGITLLTTVLIGALLLLPILGIAFITLFVPLPAIYFPKGSIPSFGSNVLVTGRQGKNVLLEQIEKLPENITSFRGLLESDMCMQRISCEIMKTSVGLHIDEWVLGIMNEIPVGHDLKWKINRANWRRDKSSWNCKRFVCDPMSSMWKIFKNV